MRNGRSLAAVRALTLLGVFVATASAAQAGYAGRVPGGLVLPTFGATIRQEAPAMTMRMGRRLGPYRIGMERTLFGSLRRTIRSVWVTVQD